MSIAKKCRLLLVVSLIMMLLAGCAESARNGSSPTVSSPAVSPGQPGSADTETPDASPAASPPASTPAASPSTSPVDSAPLGKVTALRLADFESGWAGGEGWIARTDDGGHSWTTQLEHPYVVHQLFALNGQEAWATLDTGDSKHLNLLHTTDGGRQWTDAGTVPNRAFLHFVSTEEAFSGNARTTDGGTTWTTLKLPAAVVGDAYFHDVSNGWAVTQQPGKFAIMRTTDGGKSWKKAMSRDSESEVSGVVIRSAGKNDAWVELIGDSGMSQTSYTLFHTTDGGKTWIPVLANNQAGSGPAPGFEMDAETKVPHNTGSSPGALYVVNPQTAFMGGQCRACDLPNTMGKTTDGGKTWTNLPGEFAGFGDQLIAAADANHIWWINTDAAEPSVMRTSSDGGSHWKEVYTFAKP